MLQGKFVPLAPPCRFSSLLHVLTKWTWLSALTLVQMITSPSLSAWQSSLHAFVHCCDAAAARLQTAILLFRTARIDVAAHRAYVAGKELSLTAKEFELLRVLVREAGNVVPRDTLMREVWGNGLSGSTKTLDMHVSWLRRKLGDDAASPRYITTVRGMGFRFEKPSA